ncbi:MAG: hypothetical protein C0592_11200 [Marinilabiliales bacterium]|nr:MAG: hypothetical protein C0592_11200 [Marinilabiliales bacterium]
MSLENDKRIVMTLDAGGTNFVFSAIQGLKEIIEPVSMPAEGHILDRCLQNIIDGFTRIKEQLPEEPVAISFAFPGPADYPNGIIGDLGNLPAFRGGIALGPMLEKHFKLPVFINNDGDLFAYGEALAGFLPEVNKKLEEHGNPKRFQNLVGFTLGTGFGAGFVHNGELFLGDNSGAAEVWLLSQKNNIIHNVEENISIRAIKRVYGEHAGIHYRQTPEPKDIFEIAIGQKEGNVFAAKESFNRFGEELGHALANVITLIDGLAVIGGGMSAAADLFLPAMFKELNRSFTSVDRKKYPRLVQKVFNLDDPEQMNTFIHGEIKTVKVPFYEDSITYDPLPRIGVGISKLGATKATSFGAYAYALQQLNRKG